MIGRMPTASVIVTNCNDAASQFDAVAPARTQCVPRDEIIVVHDGSIDDSPTVSKTSKQQGTIVSRPGNKGQLGPFDLSLNVHPAPLRADRSRSVSQSSRRKI